jgi:hypothetical protein
MTRPLYDKWFEHPSVQSGSRKWSTVESPQVPARHGASMGLGMTLGVEDGMAIWIRLISGYNHYYMFGREFVGKELAVSALPI